MQLKAAPPQPEANLTSHEEPLIFPGPPQLVPNGGFRDEDRWMIEEGLISGEDLELWGITWGL